MTSVSVVMATYQGERYLEQQLESILAQQVRVNEIVIVDDGSTDGTRDILSKYAAREPSIRVLFNDRNLGVNRNFEKGARAVGGDIIFFSDQDDIWMPDKVGAMLAAMESSPDCDLIFSDAQMIDSQSAVICASEFDYHKVRPVTGKPVISFFYSNCVSGHNLAVTRRALERALPFNPHLMYDHWLALVAASSGGIACLRQALVKHRIHDRNAHNNAVLRRARKKRKLGLFSKYRRMKRKAEQKVELIDDLLALDLSRRDQNYLLAAKDFFANYSSSFLDSRYRMLIESRYDDVFAISGGRGRSRSSQLRRMSLGGLYYRLYLL